MDGWVLRCLLFLFRNHFQLGWVVGGQKLPCAFTGKGLGYPSYSFGTEIIPVNPDVPVSFSIAFKWFEPYPAATHPAGAIYFWSSPCTWTGFIGYGCYSTSLWYRTLGPVISGDAWLVGLGARGLGGTFLLQTDWVRDNPLGWAGLCCWTQAPEPPLGGRVAYSYAEASALLGALFHPNTIDKVWQDEYIDVFSLLFFQGLELKPITTWQLTELLK